MYYIQDGKKNHAVFYSYIKNQCEENSIEIHVEQKLYGVNDEVSSLILIHLHHILTLDMQKKKHVKPYCLDFEIIRNMLIMFRL